MKIRESGMPSADVWQTFFHPTEALEALGLRSDMEDVVDLGCGYGTFTIPAAQITSGTVHAFDIEPEMIEIARHRAQRAALTNTSFCLRDFVRDGTGLDDSVSDYVMLFNLLHAERPGELFQECHRVLALSGLLAIIHWNYDPQTPRGPPMDIRPKPEDIVRWVEAEGFAILSDHIDLPPYHYGIVTQKK